MENEKKFYSQRGIGMATYFGGPLAAGYLVKKNYETLGQPESGKKALIIGIISTILLFAGIFAIPEPIIEKIPRALIPLIYTGLIYLIVEKIHGETFKLHKEADGKFHSNWKATGIGAIAMLIILSVIALIAFISGDFSNKNAGFDSTAYEKEIQKFVDNQNKSLTVLDEFETQPHDYILKELKNGAALWKENKNIIFNLNNTQSLPEELREQNLKLLKYCELRIKQNAILIKAVSENTDKYVNEIESIVAEIDVAVNELEQKN
jgi:hypothetical protein